MDELAYFLRTHPPFDTVDEAALDEIARVAKIERHPAGGSIVDGTDGPLQDGYVVRTGSVELASDGHMIDLATEGEMFGYVSPPTEEPPGFTALAAEDTVVYRIPAGLLRPLLERSRADTQAGFAGPPVAELIRAPALVLPPVTTIQQAARRMAEVGATSVVVDTGDGLGIVTDRDIRTRVVAAGAGPATPIEQVMTAPAWTVAADRTATEALLEMLAHGIRHLPVLTADRRLLGVLDDVDLMANERRAPFHVQAAVARSATVDDVVRAAAERHAMVIDLFDAALPPAVICRAISSVHDAVTRRLIELAHEELGPPPVPYTWLATGSFGRFEPFPGSDVDCALAWDGPDDDVELRRTMIRLAERVLAGLEACGFALDDNTVLASNPLFARSIDEWERAATTWVEDPDRDRGLTFLLIAIESDPVWGATEAAARLAGVLTKSPNRELMLRRVATAVVADRPPTGFFRDFVLHSEGERQGVLNIKRGGTLLVDSLARWSGLSAGVSAASTRARLAASRDAGSLREDDADALRDAFELFSRLRMENQVRQLREGEQPDNLIAPGDLTPVTRTALKEAFRAVARVQNRVAAEFGLRQ